MDETQNIRDELSNHVRQAAGGIEQWATSTENVTTISAEFLTIDQIIVLGALAAQAKTMASQLRLLANDLSPREPDPNMN